jgi:diguanylate cyclase (GGDEF)-like protein
VRRELAVDGLLYQEPSHGVDIELGTQCRHTLSYTLVLFEQPLGNIRFFRTSAFSELECQKVEQLLTALVYPLRNAFKYMQAIRSSFIDGLTGVKNRAAFDNALHREVELAHRQGTELSIVVLDVDHFKKVNDVYGHAAGDQVLIKIAKTLEASVRRSDMVFRYGGEEFVAILSYTSEEGAKLLANRVREQIAALDISELDGHQVTASLGIATVNEQDDVVSIFKRGDAALYRAKHLGRNRVVSAETD